MTDIFVERRFETPMTEAALAERIAQAESCFARHRAARRSSYLSLDRRRILCRFDAPDAESVRLALRYAGARTGRVWAGTFVTTDPSVAPNILTMRRFAAPPAPDDDASLPASAWSMATHDIHLAAHIVARDRRRLVCLYRAPDVASVWRAVRLQDVALDAIWAFRHIAGSGHPLPRPPVSGCPQAGDRCP